MNLMSSMANTLVGSAMAIVSVALERESGSTWYFRAVSAGMILMMPGSTSKWSRLIDGTPYWRDSRLVISSSLTNPRLTMAFPILPPLRLAWFSASWSCWGEIMFSFSSSSPSLMGMPTPPADAWILDDFERLALSQLRGHCDRSATCVPTV